MRRPVAFSLLLLLIACGGKTADEKLIKDIQPSISWVATLQFTAEEWRAKKIPDIYVRLVLKEAEKAFDNAAQTISQSQASKTLRDVIEREIAHSRVAANQLKQAVEKGDRDTAGHALQQFAAANTVLQRLHQQANK